MNKEILINIGTLTAELICALLIIIGIPALIMFIGQAYS